MKNYLYLSIVMICALAMFPAQVLPDADAPDPALIKSQLEQLSRRLDTCQETEAKLSRPGTRLDAFEDLYLETEKIKRQLEALKTSIASLKEPATLSGFEIRATMGTYDGKSVTAPLKNGEIIAFQAQISAPPAGARLSWQCYDSHGKPIPGIKKTESGPFEGDFKITRLRFMLNDFEPGKYVMELTATVDSDSEKTVSRRVMFEVSDPGAVIEKEPFKKEKKEKEAKKKNTGDLPPAGSHMASSDSPGSTESPYGHTGDPSPVSVSDMVMTAFLEKGYDTPLSAAEEQAMKQRVAGKPVPKRIKALISVLLDLRQKSDSAGKMVMERKAAYELKKAEFDKKYARANALYDRHNTSPLSASEKSAFYALQDECKVLWADAERLRNKANQGIDEEDRYLQAIRKLSLLLGQNNLDQAEAFARNLGHAPANSREAGLAAGVDETSRKQEEKGDASQDFKQEPKNYYVVVMATLGHDYKGKKAQHKFRSSVLYSGDYETRANYDKVFGPRKCMGLGNGYTCIFNFAFGPGTKKGAQRLSDDFTRNPEAFFPRGLGISVPEPGYYQFSPVPDRTLFPMPPGYQ